MSSRISDFCYSLLRLILLPGLDIIVVVPPALSSIKRVLLMRIWTIFGLGFWVLEPTSHDIMKLEEEAKKAPNVDDVTLLLRVKAEQAKNRSHTLCALPIQGCQKYDFKKYEHKKEFNFLNIQYHLWMQN